MTEARTYLDMWLSEQIPTRDWLNILKERGDVKDLYHKHLGKSNVVIPTHLKKVRDSHVTKEELISFETEVKEKYESGDIKSPVHLSKNNEDELIEIFQYIHKDDWVFSAWRNHYHALLHGFNREQLMKDILDGRSMETSSNIHKFYSSAIVGGIIPLALGTAMALKRKGSDRKVWCFVGDMTFETGVFHESYKYARNFDLPLEFVVEDNNLSVHTPTDEAWKIRQKVPSDIVYYRYENGYPHHGTGAWVNF